MLLDLNSGFEIDWACCVDEAFKKLSAKKYDVVVSDYEMPQKDGFQFLSELRKHNNSIPFILFTGKGREEVAIKALNLGVEGYFNKQGSPETVYGELCYGIIQTVDHKRDEEDLRKNENTLKNSEEQYRAYTENSPVAFFVVNPEGKYIQVNDAATKLLLYSKNELLKMSIVDIMFEKDISFQIKQFTTLKETGESRFETALKRKNGEPAYVILNATRLPDGNIMAFCENITERVKVEKALRGSEEKFRLLFENAPDIICTADLNGKLVDANTQAKKVLGYNKEGLIGKSVLDLFTKDDAAKILKDLSNSLQGQKTGAINYDMKTKGGTIVPVEISTFPVRIGDGVEIIGIARDISERKKAEEAIRFHADLLNHVGQAVIMVDNNRIIRFWNKAAEKFYGYSEEQALGHQINELLGNPPREEAEKVLSKLMAGESWSSEACIKNKDGSVVPVILNRTPIFKENGEFSGAASITTDITLQKSIEADLSFSLESLSYSLDKIKELNEKLRVVGDLTRHDVRNKLSAVTGYAYILKKKHADEADVVDQLVKMEQAVADSMKIFDFAKMYEQIGSEELIYVNVEEKLKEASALISGPIPMIKNECHGLTVLADSFLRQLFYNFIDNTRKYGKKTTIIRVHYEKPDQDGLKLVYEDDGVGIPLENKPSLFKEGFSTGGSTGFGLFLTKKMIDVYGWTITEEGEPGKGAKFTLTIPKLNKNGKENYQIVP